VLKLPDHEASLDPTQFKRLVERVHLVNKALGSGVKRILPTEQKWRRLARKSLFATQDIQVGTKIKVAHITIRRPSDGIHPKYLSLIIGRAAKVDIKSGTIIDWKMV
jgi:sialic acid synthase SpsE